MNSAQIKKTEELNLNHFMQGLMKLHLTGVSFYQTLHKMI